MLDICFVYSSADTERISGVIFPDTLSGLRSMREVAGKSEHYSLAHVFQAEVPCYNKNKR